MRRIALLSVALLLALLPAAGAGAKPSPASLVEWAASGQPVPQAQPAAPASEPGPAPEALTYYASRADFDAAYPGLPLEDFEEGAVAPGGVVPCPHPVDSNGSGACFAMDDILVGVAFWASADHSDDEIALVGAGFYGNASKNIVSNVLADYFRIVFDPPVLAAGMDLMGYFGQDTCTLDVFGASGPLGSTSGLCSELGPFWGVGSDVPIVEIDVTSPVDNAEGVDNIAFGSPAQPNYWAP